MHNHRAPITDRKLRFARDGVWGRYKVFVPQCAHLSLPDQDRVVAALARALE